jgi:hypothetical protein
MREPEPGHGESDPYWTDEVDLGLLYFGRDHRAVTLRSHISDERFFGRGSETLFSLSEREGLRTYVQSRFLTQPPVGRLLRVADAQAWVYPADHTAVIWELLLQPPFASQDPRESLLLRSLWTHYESFLATRFPDLNQVMTTWEDDYQRDRWQGFLMALGYHPTAPATFVKIADHHA